MSGVGFNLPEIINNRWAATRAYVLLNPISAAVYDVALKVFGLYCQSYIYPIGVSISLYMITASLVFDFAIFGQIMEYKTRFFDTLVDTQRKFWAEIYNFRDTQIFPMGRKMLEDLFTVNRGSAAKNSSSSNMASISAASSSIASTSASSSFSAQST